MQNGDSFDKTLKQNLLRAGTVLPESFQELCKVDTLVTPAMFAGKVTEAQSGSVTSTKTQSAATLYDSHPV